MQSIFPTPVKTPLDLSIERKIAELLLTKTTSIDNINDVIDLPAIVKLHKQLARESDLKLLDQLGPDGWDSI